MGYTHYWRTVRIPALKKIEAFVKDVRAIYEDDEVKDLICYEDDRPEFPPVAHMALIRFNGKGDDGYETFFYEPGTKGSQSWFCKTERKPYDFVVCAVLIAAHHHFGKSVDISSDGDWDTEGEWPDGAVLYERVTNRKAGCPWPVKACIECDNSYARDNHNWGGGGRYCANCGNASWLNGACMNCGSKAVKSLVSDDYCYWCGSKRLRAIREAEKEKAAKVV